MEHGSPLLRDIVVYLAAAVVLVPLFIRFKLGAVLGYLAAGILIGPAVLGLVGNAEQTLQFAEFAIVLLLFVIGLELQPSRLWALRRDIFGLGLAQVLLCGLALTGLLLALTSLSWQTALMTVVALGFLVLVGRYALPRLFRIIGSLGAREAFVAAALLCVMGSALLMASLGLSMALGAFVAGVMLAESPYRHALEADIEPFRGLMLGLFFIAIGMSLDLRVVAANWGLVAALVVGVLAVKSAAIAALARSFGTDWRPAIKMGILLAQGGEFGFVLFAEAERGLLITHQAAQLFGAVVTLSMAFTPLLFRLAGRMFAVNDDPGSRDGPESAGGEGHGGHVVLVGSGRVGQVIAQMLRARGQPLTAIDLDAELIDVTARFGNTVFWGDGTRLDILRTAGIDRASALVFAMDGQWDPKLVLEPIREQWPDLPIIARAYDRVHNIALRQAGVEQVVRETLDGAVAMGREVLTTLGTPDTMIDAIEAEYRRRDLERLDLQLCSGDIMSGAETIIRGALDLDGAADPASLGEIPPA